ncbi:MAG: hypothetical protein WBO23_18775 [Burkholderiales bacterium]
MANRWFPGKWFSNRRTSHRACTANAKSLVFVGLFFKAREGIAIPPEDADALARSVADLADNRERCVALGLQGRRFASESYNRDVLAMQMLAELERVVGPGGDH